jgi:hypothetical protein
MFKIQSPINFIITSAIQFWDFIFGNTFEIDTLLQNTNQYYLFLYRLLLMV